MALFKQALTWVLGIGFVALWVYAQYVRLRAMSRRDQRANIQTLLNGEK